MRKPLLIIIIVIALCCPCITQAKNRTGVELLNGCRKIISLAESKELGASDRADAFFWTGYILATIDAQNLLRVETENWICFPDKSIKIEQIARIIFKRTYNQDKG